MKPQDRRDPGWGRRGYILWARVRRRVLSLLHELLMTAAIHIILFFCALLLAMCGVLAVAPFVWGRTPVVDEEKALVETDVDDDDEPAELRGESTRDVSVDQPRNLQR